VAASYTDGHISISFQITTLVELDICSSRSGRKDLAVNAYLP